MAVYEWQMTHTEILYMIDKKIQFQIKFYSSFITVYYYLNWSFFSYSSLWEHRTEFHFGTLKVTKLYMVQVSG